MISSKTIARSDPFCCTYFGRISIRTDIEHDKSLVNITNYLLLKETDFILDGVIEELACTHNYALLLSLKPSMKLYRIRVDGNDAISCLNFVEDQCQEMHFQPLFTPAEIKSMKLTPRLKPELDQTPCDRLELYQTYNLPDPSQASYKTPELVHCEENEKCILERIRKCSRSDGAVPPGLICCTDARCYLVTNSESGPSLWIMFTENAINNEVKMLQIGCREAINSLKAGKSHVLLLSSSGLVYSFGTGNHGELGHGTLESEQMPKLIDCLSVIPIVQIACGGWHSVALTNDGDVYVWGWNSCGQLDSTDSSVVNFPLPLDIDDKIIAVSAYRNATLLKKATNDDIVVLGSIGFDCR